MTVASRRSFITASGTAAVLAWAKPWALLSAGESAQSPSIPSGFGLVELGRVKPRPAPAAVAAFEGAVIRGERARAIPSVKMVLNVFAFFIFPPVFADQVASALAYPKCECGTVSALEFICKG